MNCDGGVLATVESGLHAVDVATAPHPGFPTDLQPQFTAFLSQVEGTSRVWERVYDRRETHIGELARLGLILQKAGDRIDIQGNQRARSGRVHPQDIRSAAAVIVAAAGSSGTTVLLDEDISVEATLTWPESSIRSASIRKAGRSE